MEPLEQVTHEMSELLCKDFAGQMLAAKQKQGGQSLPASDCFKR
jgi:hypothetical protein